MRVLVNYEFMMADAGFLVNKRASWSTAPFN